jgi:hypothetical protein
MHMIRGNHIVKDTKPVALLRFKEPIEPSLAIGLVLEQKGFLVATVSKVPEIARKEMSGGARHTNLRVNGL